MKVAFRQLVLPVVIIGLLVVIAFLASRHSSLEWFVHNDRWLRMTIRANPVTSAALAFAIYLVMSLIPGPAGKSILLGWLFGLVTGVIIVNTALVSAAVVTFLVCRHCLKSTVEFRFGFYLQPIRERCNATVPCIY